MKLLIKKTIYSIDFFKPKNRIEYYRFGYNPNGYLRADLLSSIIGTKNLYKHYQARDIIHALDIQDNHNVLDFGCGSGYMSIEVAKKAKFTVAVDINPSVSEIAVPEFLKDKLTFLNLSEHELTYENIKYRFDRILLSEVILSVGNLDLLLANCRNVLAPDGKLIIVNGLGKPYIKKNLFDVPWVCKILKRFPKNAPKNYAEYEKLLCGKFGNHASSFLDKDQINLIMSNSGFVLCQQIYSPKLTISNTIEAAQFAAIILNRKKQSTIVFFLMKFYFAIVDKLQKRKSEAGFIGVFKENNAGN